MAILPNIHIIFGNDICVTDDCYSDLNLRVDSVSAIIILITLKHHLKCKLIIVLE